MSYAPHVVAMLLGGLAPSVGLMFLARSGRGKALLGRAGGRAFAGTVLVVAAASAAAAYFMARSILEVVRRTGTGDTGPHLPAPGAFLVFGLALGIILAVPGVTLAWMDVRARARERSKRKDHVPTKDERRSFAADLARQIRELSVPRREVEVSVGGDGDRVLVIEGPLEAEEGEKLAAALRGDLKELGFKRVEGSGGRKEWWVPV